MLVGLQTNQAWGPADFGLIRPDLDEPPQFTSAKLMQTHGCRHNENEIATLRELGIEHFIMRLGDSVYEPDTLHPTKWRPTPIQFAEDNLRLINRFVRVDVLDYQISCEDNIIQAALGIGPANFGAWLLEVLRHMRERKLRDGWDLPPGVRLGLPPMAMAEEFAPYEWIQAMREASDLCAFICANTYWQSSRQGRTNILAGPLRWRQFGASYEYLHDVFPDMPIQVVEWGNSIQEQGVLSPQQVDELRREQYPIWLEFAAAAGYIEATHVFISQGATNDWNGFKVTPALARVIAHSLATPRLQGQSRRLSGGRAGI